MIEPRPAIVGVALLAVAVSWRRPALRPVAVGLLMLAAIDVSRACGLPGRADVGAWVAWPLVSAALSWHAWRGEAGRGWWALPVAYALAVALAPWSWAAHPWAYAVTIGAPFTLSPLCSVLAWSAAMPSRDRAEVAARRVAGLLAWSGFVDVVVGALAPGATYDAAAPLAWVTWAAIGGVLGWEAAKGRLGQ